MSKSKSIHAWERLGWVWSVIFYVTLVVPLVYWLYQRDVPQRERLLVITLTLIAGLVHWMFAFELPRRGVDVRSRRSYGLIYAAILIGVMFGLVAVHEIFFFVIGGFFSQLFYYLHMGWSIPIFLISMSALALQANEVDSLADAVRQPSLWIWLVGGVGGSLIALWIGAIIRQGYQQQELIAELHRTQTELAASERTAGVLAERQRLAREIHDTLAQSFISVVTHLEAADQALENGVPTARHHIEQAAATARESLGQARRVVQDLRPEALDDSSLPEAVERETAKWSQRTGIPVKVVTTGSALPLHPQAEVTLLRAVQEALANVHKHAEAGHVNITLSYMPDRVLLDVQDDGKGFQPESDPPASNNGGGFGLIAMRQRIEALTGSLLIESGPGEGTTVVVEIPRLIN